MTPDVIILSIFGCIVSIQIIYYLFIFSGFSFSKKEQKSTQKDSTPVSIIVCARNEAENITKLVPQLVGQKHDAPFEIILVNDASYDETEDLMDSFAEQHQNIKIVKVKEIETNVNWSSKKYALTLGIKAAKYNHLLLTDADCIPLSNNWISLMTSHFTEKKKIILGYGGYKTIKNSFVNKLVRFETLLTAIQYFSFAKRGNPYMGVGRNLAYTREVFFENDGFANHMKILSGDDDLFVNGAANKNNTAICFHKEAATTSVPKKTFSEWIDQKRRHISTASFYKGKDKFYLGLFYSSQLLFIVGTLTVLALQLDYIIVAALISSRYLFSYLSIGFGAGKLNEKGILPLYPIIEIVLIFSQLYLFITNLFIKPNRWR
ncbi:MAG: glycosyltransferase [Flavobacteriales bacterium]|nr:glycosyltransferase [Flavobacteriales bacterium]